MGAPTAIFLPVLLLWTLTERNCTAQDRFVIDEIAPESRGTLLLSNFPGSLFCTVSVAAVFRGPNSTHLRICDNRGAAAAFDSAQNTVT